MESKYISYDADMRTMMYRYSVLANYMGINFEGADKTSEKLSKADAEEILRENYSEQKERILFLCGTGVLNYDNIKPLIIRNNTTFIDDVIALEQQLMADTDKSDDERVPYSILENSLIVSAISKKYNNVLTTVDFSQIMSSLRMCPDVSVVNGLIACKSDYIEFLREIGLDFVKINADTGNVELYDEIRNDKFFDTLISNLVSISDIKEAFDSDDVELKSKAYDYPFAADSKKCLDYLKVYNKVFGKEFLKDFSGKSEDIENAYDDFVNYKKLTINISGYVRRRKVCGDTVNHYDYDYNVIENNELTKSELVKGQDYNAVVKLSKEDAKGDFSSEMMLEKALNKYKKQIILPDRFVAEIFYDKQIHYFVYDYNTDKFTAVSADLFTKQLFDFNKVWGLVRKAAAERRIIAVGNNITFPYLDELSHEEQLYAIEIAREQYERQKAQRNASGQISTLKKLISNAKEGAEAQAAEKAAAEEAKKARLAEAQAKKNNRINNNASDT